jgi:protease-4
MLQTLHQAALYVAVKSIITVVIITSLLGAFLFYDKTQNEIELPFSDQKCNVAVIPINGFISTLSEDVDEYYSVDADDVVYQLRAADSQDHIKAILLQIDSSGGRPVASEMITNELLRTSKPTVALIREGGTSGAYLLATGADTIIASTMSDVGSIGITASYVETAGSVEQEGNKYIELIAGKYKDYGSPEKPLTNEERALIQRDLDATHNDFINIVAKNRNLPIEEIRQIADGSSMTGKMALDKKLIDVLGDSWTAEAWITEKTGEGVVYCDLW